jgi:hypothetical protein
MYGVYRVFRGVYKCLVVFRGVYKGYIKGIIGWLHTYTGDLCRASKSALKGFVSNFASKFIPLNMEQKRRGNRRNRGDRGERGNMFIIC